MGGSVRASRDSSTATLPPPSQRGHRHSPAPTAGRHSARRKVTNFLLIPPRAPLFRPPSSWDIALMAFSPGRVCGERAESTRVCGENMQSVHGESVPEVHGALHRASVHGACRRAMGCAQRGQARGCAARVHTVCKEDAQSTGRTQMEHADKTAQSVYGVCRVSTEPAWPL